MEVSPIRLSACRSRRAIYSLRALGRGDVPDRLLIGEQTYHLAHEQKHDFWAATAFYDDGDGHRVVLKIARTQPFLGLPFQLIGRWSQRRETRLYRRLADLPNVPKHLGLVGRTGFVHEFVPGRPLEKSLPTPDGFFDALFVAFDELHRRGIAYMDANKPQNILVGDDGRPYLIDFQISIDRETLRRIPFATWILGKLQCEDRYHLLKHKRRMRPDEMTADQREASGRKSWLIRAHRLLTRPYFAFRRRTFSRLRRSGQLVPEGSK